MRPPSDIARLTAAARAQGTSRSLRRVEIPQQVQMQPPTTRSAAPGRSRGTGAPAKAQTRSTQSIQGSPGTGINHWWRYQEQSIPGGGRMMTNVGTGNLLVQDDDMAIPHKGIAMTFRRTYNSQSLHDLAGSDGSEPGMYGNGWTNTFDAHVVKLSDGIRSVYDVDGARYDYAMPANPTWAPGMILHPATPGNYDYLQFDGQCGWYWIKKTGTIYYFYTNLTDPGTGCPVGGALGAYSGRLYRIYGRNNNTYLTFSYSWDNGDASIATGKVNAITVQAESGMTANLAFADVAGHRLLQSIVLPDGATSVTYGYDSTGNLTSVSHPPNNASGTRPQQTYGYQSVGTGSTLYWIYSPRLNASVPFGSDGHFLAFLFDGTNQPTATLSEVAHWAFVNPSIPDGTSSTVLQPGYSSGGTYYQYEYYTSGSTPTWRDTDGHATNWVVDSLGRVTQTQECVVVVNQACSGTPLTSTESWDPSNNLISESDARGNVTDYAYDVDGNTIAVAQPAPANGGFRPTSLYTYGAYDNLVAYCDPIETHALQADWTTRPVPPIPVGAGSCPTQGSPNWHATYTYPWYEPFGELISMTTPMGYTRTFSYAPSQQGGNDFGLPTAVTGDAIAQVDGTIRTPTQTFWYDASGDLRCFSKGQGTWGLSYDVLGRMTSIADPDDSSANGSSLCGKSSGQSGWNTQTTKTYFPDGSLQSTQTPAERAGNVSTTFTYDVDGDVLTETHHHGCTAGGTCTAGVTKKWYDGADRLLETMLPRDPTDYYRQPYGGSPWITRNFYDLTAGGQVSFGGASFAAHGNLYKTQEAFAGTYPAASIDLKGQSFDSLDRPLTTYPGSFGPIVKSYDGSASSLGLLTTTTDALGEVTTYGYDEQGRQNSVQFSHDGGLSPDRTITYDPNGHAVSMHSTMFGTWTAVYDADGRNTEVDEFNGGTQPVSSPAQIKYAYYGDGSRKTLSVISSALTADPLMAYAYRADGARTLLRVTKAGVTSPVSWTYTDGGRLLTQIDPATGTTIPSPSFPNRSGSTFRNTAYSYSAGGSISGVTLPVNANYVSITRDDEGGITGYKSYFSAPSGGTFPLAAVLNITSRGESQALNESYTGPDQITTSGNIWAKMNANGFMVDTDEVPFDERSSIPLAPGLATIPENCNFGQTPVAYYTYDAAGRRTYGQLPNLDPDLCQDRGWQTTTGFDAENHTTSYSRINLGSDSECLSARWSPLAQLTTVAVCGNSGTPETYHYDGSNLLFTSHSTALDVLNVETIGEVLPNNTLEIADRDYAGLRVMTHSPAGYSAWDSRQTIMRYKFPATVGQYVPGSTANQFSYPANAPLYVHPDGFETDFGTIQGTRVSDQDGWTTPDAYAGAVHDPMSMKSYMWNRNNPYTYSDPSGYLPITFLPFLPGQLECARGPQLCGNYLKAAGIAIGGMILPDPRPLFDPHASAVARINAALQVGMAFTPGGRFKGKAVEIASGVISESGLLEAAQKFLGSAYKELGNGRYVSADGLRQFRLGSHEVKDPNNIHAHFETYNRPGGQVTETSTVTVTPDKH